MATRGVAQGHRILPLGSQAPDFALPGVDGKIHRLHEYDNSPVLMIVFWVTQTCPTALKG
jgi:peroxiredoxin